ncbi:MAG: phage Gp37/Gp68 family protein [Muribaculaceae bacterium]|nr:phage Gp37/Gp68 family protein [Muribaculaceae bacterium]
MPMWNPWHGCHKISACCKHCYVYREDAAFGTAVPSFEVRKTSSFNLPIRRDRKRNWKFPSGTEFALCFTSDFLIEEADEWRNEIWDIIRMRKDCRFFFFTKRIERLSECLPEDWNDGYDHVAIGCTVENQDRANFRMPVFLSLPIKHRLVIVAPMIERIDLRPYLIPSLIEEVSVGGESGKYARALDYDWVLDMHRQCKEAKIPFCFHQTGSYLIKDGRCYHIPRSLQHSQAKKAGLNNISHEKINKT